MKPRLENKVALVTGGAQGIGAARAALCGEHGARVIVNVREHTPAAQALALSLGAPDEVLLLAADVSRRAEVEAMGEREVSHFGRLDVSVKNAGINVFDVPLLLSDEAWARCFSVDLEGAWHCARAVLPHM